MISRQSIVALQHRNFRLLWIGLLISFSGSLMQNAALLWHVSLLVPPEEKGWALGLVGLVRVVPIVVFSLIAGVVADALNRRKLMLLTQITAAAVALALAVLTFRGLSDPRVIYALAALSAAVGAFDLPARQALVPMLVPREHLPNAISLNTSMFQAASVLGPAISGLVIASSSVAWVYVLNAVSFGFVIVALLMMRNVPASAPAAVAVIGGAGEPETGDERSAGPPVRQEGVTPELTASARVTGTPELKLGPTYEHGAREQGRRADISINAAREGLRFVFRSPIIRSTMLLDFFATFFSSATALLPIFAQDILHVGARGYGWLFAAPAVGAVITSIALVPLAERIQHRGQTLLWAIGGYGVATVVFGLSRSFWLTFACLALTGVTDTISTVIRNIIRQLETPDRLRGRMMGINMVFFMGGPQLGEFEAGAVANWAGAPVSVITGGVGCLIATAWIAWSTPMIRRYRK